MDWRSNYIDFVRWIGDSSSASDSLLHVHGGMFVLLLTRVVSGKSLATPWPLFAVIVAALAKEAGDYLAYGHIKPDSMLDILNTVFWPTVLMVGLRVRRAQSPGGHHRDN